MFCFVEVDKPINIYQTQLYFVFKKKANLQTINIMKKALFSEKGRCRNL